MKVTWNSEDEQLRCEGQLPATPRIWVLAVRAVAGDGTVESMTFRPGGKVRVGMLAPLVHQQLRQFHDEHDGLRKVSWTALAR